MENIPESLRRARRNLPCLPEYNCVEDWQKDETSGLFYLHFSVKLSRFSEHIPAYTEWYLTSPSNYPSGNIEVYPSVTNGITATFPHQSCNAFVKTNGLWRSGNLCLNSISTTLHRNAFDKAPINIPERLYWHVERTISWLYAAVDGTLTQSLEPFETPDFATQSATGFRAVYNEDAVSCLNWSDEDEQDFRGGTVDYFYEVKNRTVYMIPKQYDSFDKKFCYSPAWGSAYKYSSSGKSPKGLWFLLRHIPSVNVWQAPVTLHDLCRCCQMDGINLLDEIKKFMPSCRDGQRHAITIGFPVPQVVDGPYREITWRTFLLPILSYKKKYTSLGVQRGFRFNETGWRHNDCTTILHDNMELDWLPSENWNRETISSRGHLSQKMRNKKFLLIGCGSLGSCIAEILARSAAYKITCLDRDILSSGNLCRHTLTSASLSRSKASALASHLADTSPCLEVSHIDDSFQFTDAGQPNVDIAPYDIIIDTTGEDSVLQILSSISNEKQKAFISCSIGLGAEHLYFGAQKSYCPDFSPFLSLVSAYCNMDLTHFNISELPREGIGCWHPLFPARSDDMWLAASTCVKTLEKFIINPNTTQLNVIYKQKCTGMVSEGYQPIEVQQS